MSNKAFKDGYLLLTVLESNVWQSFQRRLITNNRLKKSCLTKLSKMVINRLKKFCQTWLSKTVIDASFIGACRPRIFFINGFLCFLEDKWQRNGERKREKRRHFKEKMSLEEAHHHRRPWIIAWRKKEMNEGRGREEHEILCSKWALKSEV